MTSPNASSSKRLFLFAAYDKDCLIDDNIAVLFGSAVEIG